MLADEIIRYTAGTLADLEYALHHPQTVQHAILRQIIDANRNTPFGRAHHFADIHTAEDYAQAVPIQSYEDFQTAIERIYQFQHNDLTAESVIQFECTGGSSGGAKYIPYTPSLLHAFQRGIHAWLGDLAMRRPQAFTGKLFFIISPAMRTENQSPSGIPIGNGDDLTYLGEHLATLFAPHTLFQAQLLAQQSPEQWLQTNALMLAQAPDLSLISVWSPTLLMQILHTLHREQDQILPHITSPSRQQQLSQALSSERIHTPSIWAQLDTISCWDSHTASAPAQTLRELFPHAIVQGKGLLATEAISTIPFGKHQHTLPTLTSHYYEFADDNHRIYPIHQLKTDTIYRLIITTQGGLYRYDTGDYVMAQASEYAVPALRFMGRGHLYSDVCGEKLNERFVAHIMNQCDTRFTEYCVLQAIGNQYTVIAPPSARIWLTPELLAKLDQGLATNPQYHYARQIGQLAPLTIKWVEHVDVYALSFNKQKKWGVQKVGLLLPAIEA